jgi:uncharacterized protein (TIGR00725 family)
MNRTIAVAVSGGTDVSLYEREADIAAREIVEALLCTKVVILTGANVGFPDMVSKYAEERGVPTVRFSSESSYRTHIVSPRASIEHATALIYTGFGLAGADTILVRSADIVIIGPGAVGTIHEFAGALEEGKILGVLTGPWHTDEIAVSIANLVGAHEHKVIFESNPNTLVSKLLNMLGE